MSIKKGLAFTVRGTFFVEQAGSTIADMQKCIEAISKLRAEIAAKISELTGELEGCHVAVTVGQAEQRTRRLEAAGSDDGGGDDGPDA